MDLLWEVVWVEEEVVVVVEVEGVFGIGGIEALGEIWERGGFGAILGEVGG